MNFIYILSVILLSGAFIVYGYSIVFLSCFLVACQPLGNSLNTEFNEKVNNVNDLDAEKKITHNDVKATKIDIINNLNNLLTNPQSQEIPQEWYSSVRSYRSLSPEKQEDIAKFYQEHNHTHVWLKKDGQLTSVAFQIIDRINQEFYFTTPIKGEILSEKNYLVTNNLSADIILRKDLAFTIDLIKTLEKIRNGLTISHGLGINSNNGYKPFDTKKILSRFLTDDSNIVVNDFTNFHPQYAWLKQEVKRLNIIKAKGGYISVPFNKILKIGMTDKNIPIIRQRLFQAGLLTNHKDSEKFDADLLEKVRSFQESRGLRADGIIGSQVYSLLNKDVNSDLKNILINFERIRRSPEKVAHQLNVQVNIPEMTLKVIKNNQILLSMKTIVGRADRTTPIFNDYIEYVDFNPYWNIPHSIATKDILPKLKYNSSYLTQQSIKIFKDNKPISSRSINWHDYSENYFPFTLRQEPGKNNALGTVKFIFPNDYSVYLHDTPAKNIFAKSVRSESSGCIRVAEPKELAYVLLNDVVSKEKINKIFSSSKNKALYTAQEIPISIEYLTAFINQGILNIRSDIYNYDALLFNELNKAIN